MCRSLWDLALNSFRSETAASFRVLLLISRGHPRRPPWWLRRFAISRAAHGGCGFSTSPALVIFCLFFFFFLTVAILTGVREDRTAVSIRISLMIRDLEHLLIMLVGHSHIIFGQCLFKWSAYFEIELLDFCC